MPSQNLRHLLLVPLPAYALAGRLAAEPDVVVTLLIAPNWLGKARTDLKAYFPDGHEGHERIRILSIFQSRARDADFLGHLGPMSTKHYPGAYKTLYRGESIKCATTGKTFPAVPLNSSPRRMFLECDGAFLGTSPAYEGKGETLAAL
ncbi:hypothetical protein B0H16DRAFT_1569910 [Mycena metata]|uniref:Uncharacterized protein n=1 Tax=Mycena metata TaxID=1033252 RepID=A0AAD7IAQ2_9AGAR|nr:hypothetical protein B0H16DRAFT_1569910 [Mycena metata]